MVLCKSCGKEIGAGDLDLASRVARCRSCKAVFDFSSQIDRGPDGAAPIAARRRGTAPLPDGITLDFDAPPSTAEGGPYRSARAAGPRFTITRRWFGARYVVQLLFCIAWDSFLIFWYEAALHAQRIDTMSILFPIAHVAVGIALTYSTLAGLFNRSVIIVGDGHLEVRHRPLPWIGNRRVATSALSQVYCEEHISSGKSDTTATYSLNAILDGKKLTLLAGLPSADQALFIEQEVESRIGIVDQPVRGEYRA